MIPIDDYEAAIDLSKRLNATMPFQVRVGKELLKKMQSGGESVTANTLFNVTLVAYSGDVGGINCGLEPADGELLSSAYVVSITHVKIDSAHPLAEEVQTYQQNRIRGLKLQEKMGFAAELLSQKTNAKRKSSKGFGKLS